MKYFQAIVIAVLAVSSAAGDDTNSPPVPKTVAPALPPYRVSVRLSNVNDNEADSVVRSYLRREFLKITDIDLVDDDNTHVDLTVSFLAIHSKNFAGNYTGYSLSFAVVDTSDIIYACYLMMSNPNIDKATQAKIANVLFKDGRLVDHFVDTTSEEGLEGICKREVAAIDGADIERVRKFVINTRAQNAANAANTAH